MTTVVKSDHDAAQEESLPVVEISVALADDNDTLSHDNMEERESEDSMSDVTESRDLGEDPCWDTDLEIEDEKPEYYLSGPRIYQETCQELGVVPVSYFSRHMQEETVVMRHHGLGPMGAKALAIPLVTNTCVTHLDLDDNWIQAEGAIHLAEMLKENCYISHLNLSNNRFGHQGAIVMCDMLQQNSSLISVNLSGNGFGDKDGALFAEAILSNSRVRELNLSHNDLGSGSGSALGHAIGENETIESLDLGWNHFRCQAALDIVEGIKVNSRLKRVSLAWNGLGDTGAAAVASCLQYNHVITQLDISNNRITKDGVPPLAKALDVNETLAVFKIGQNPIGTVGALSLLQAMNSERSTMKEFDLTDVCVDKEFDKLYQEMLQSRELVIQHGGVLGSFSQQPSPKKPKGDELGPEELAALRALEDFLQNDPMALLQAHVKKRNLRLVDLFREYDKDKDYKISAEDFKRSVKQGGIDLAEDKIDQLLQRLDRSKDGRIDYSTLAFGKSKAVVRRRRLSRVVIDTFESTGRTSLPADMMTSSPVMELLSTSRTIKT